MIFLGANLVLLFKIFNGSSFRIHPASHQPTGQSI